MPSGASASCSRDSRTTSCADGGTAAAAGAGGRGAPGRGRAGTRSSSLRPRRSAGHGARPRRGRGRRGTPGRGRGRAAAEAARLGAARRLDDLRHGSILHDSRVDDPPRRRHVLREPALARRALVGVRLLQRLGAHGRCRGRLGGGAAARRPAVGARVAAGRLAARRLDARRAPPAADGVGRPGRVRRPPRALRRPRERHRRHRRGARVRRQLRLRPAR